MEEIEQQSPNKSLVVVGNDSNKSKDASHVCEDAGQPEDGTEVLEKMVVLPKTAKKRIIDSDCETEGNLLEAEIVNDNVEEVTNIKKKTFRLIDSDSEPESKESTNMEENINEAPIYTATNEKEIIADRNLQDSLTALCDPDTSDDEEKPIKPLVYRKKFKKKGEQLEEKRMTAKEAAEQRKEIESDSQRRFRETHVSLPYHKPKQRSLKEFLQNRPRFASSVPFNIAKVSAAIAIKMNKEQIEFVSKRMQEREKQLEEFYKSESEEDESNEEAEVKIVSANATAGIETDVTQKTSAQEGELLPKETIESEKKVEEPEKDKSQIAADPVDRLYQTAETEALKMEINESNKKLDKDACIELEFNICNSDEKGYTLIVDETIKTAPETADDTTSTKRTTLELLMEHLGDTQPKLSGAPNYVIDLEKGTTHLDEVTQLIQRFEKHTNKKPVHKKASAVELDVMCVSQSGEVHKEKVAVKVDEHEEPAIEEKPGVKYQKLKNDLQTQMAQRRNELWREKQDRLQVEKAANADDDFYNGEKTGCGIDDILDDEEEEFSDLDSDTDEENDEQSDEEDKNSLIANEAAEDEDSVAIEDGEDGAANNVVDYDNILKPTKKKKLRRIVQPVVTDSEEETDITCTNENKEDRCMDSTVSWPDDDDLISAGQSKSCKTPQKQPCMQTKSELGFISPVCRLTGLQSFDATGKFLQNSPGSPAIKLGESSPFKSSGVCWSKSLFVESPLKNVQKLEELSSQIQSATVEAILNKDMEELEMVNEPSTQDMLELCSGNFGFTQTQNTNIATHCKEVVRKEVEKDQTKNKINNSIEVNNERVAELPIDEDDDRFISQLIDEDELENFKKKFESPLESSHSAPYGDKRIAMQLAFDALNDAENDNSSEDEDEEELQLKNIRKLKKKKIIDSDDEETAKDNEENINLHDEDSNSGDDVIEEVDIANQNNTELGYDSEENEILVEKPKKSKKLVMKDFVENEAELSESEWGSEDEDERHLDVIEPEEGDKEQFDREQLKDELEKIHMKRILDDDKKALKVLQELYIEEDEELAGAGRQRQFRWRNIDNVDNVESSIQDDETLLHDDEGENEEEWRKKRHERELYLQSQNQEKGEEDDAKISLIVSNSQLFKLGQRAMIQNKRTWTKTAQNVNIKQAYVLNSQRGSFLSRKDEVLSRVEQYTKVSGVVPGGTKTSRNFVFQSVAPNSAETSTSSTSFEDKKRKANGSCTPAQLKRLRLNGFSPADRPKKADSRSKARLFSDGGTW